MDGLSERLPGEYLERMRDILGDEYEDFLRSYDEDRTYGLRINPLKVSAEDADRIVGKVLAGLDDPVRIPWCIEGYYYSEDSCPGRSPYHEAGAYYIQEPSAMAVGTMLDPRPGDIICDLCAAPGGKTTHIAGRMYGQGLLLSNEIVPGRASVLSRNVERMGITNCIVTSVAPSDLADRLPQFFTKVCVDAPCSGEGMFRKDEAVIGEWSISAVENCATRQLDILDAAARLTSPGGIIVYSTCTFERAEDEDVIDIFLSSHPEWELEEMKRIWPHKARGEGHFAAKLKKIGESPSYKMINNRDFVKENLRSCKGIDSFLDTELGFKEDSGPMRLLSEGKLIMLGGGVWIVPEKWHSQKTSSLRIIRSGLKVAEYDGKRFKPDHALAMASRIDEINNVCDLNENEVIRYLNGETISLDPDRIQNLRSGWCLAAFDGLPIGWGKIVGTVLKNHYPKGLRKMLAQPVITGNSGIEY